jgi:Flp pilus assembly protein TadD
MTDTDTIAADKLCQSLLAQALGLIERNQLVEAEVLIERCQAVMPENPDAYQLLGLIRRQQGRGDEAEVLYRHSLDLKADQPQVHYNLGNLLRAAGRLADAEKPLREAVRLKPNYAEAHLTLGLVLHDMKQLADAEASYRQALRLQPNYLLAKQSLGAVLNDLNRPVEAERILRQALATGSANPRQVAALEHNLGVAVQLQHRHEQALSLFDAAQSKVPDMPYVDHNRGNSLQSLGEIDRALESYWLAVRRDPLDMEAHYDLNQLLYRLGDDESFLRSFDDAAALYPEVSGIPFNKGNFLLQKGDYEAANAAFVRAARLHADSVSPLDGQGLALARLGRFDDAIHAHETALKMEPENADVWRNYAETLLRSGDAAKGLAAAERSLAISPQHQGTLAIYGTALQLLDDPRDASLNDYENFVQVFELEPPQGYGDMESFNRDLNVYLDRLHRDRREMISQSLRGGTQTMENLFGRGHDLVERLRARIDQAVATYIARMKENETHPLLMRRRAAFAYSGSWSSRLHDCGYHTNHFHPKGWISSAYYVDLPESVNDSEGKQGWIKFGEPAFETALREPVRRVIQPRTGRLVLFPSYMWHGTVPFQSQRARTTIAFDIVPR